jgi:hypothetical protein
MRLSYPGSDEVCCQVVMWVYGIDLVVLPGVVIVLPGVVM